MLLIQISLPATASAWTSTDRACPVARTADIRPDIGSSATRQSIQRGSMDDQL